MKPHVIILFLAAAGLVATAADNIQFSQLPEPVKKTVTASKGADAIKSIEQTTKDGRIVYQVEFQRAGANPKLLVGVDGSVITDSRKDIASDDRTDRTDRTDSKYKQLFKRTPTLKLSDVPAAVQKTVQEKAAGREVVDIDRETWNGRTVYEVEFAQSGRNAQIHVAEDGTMVKDERDRTKTGVGFNLFGFYLGTQLEDTPAAVQETIKREAKGREIVDIDKERREGQTMYEVEIKQPEGNVELHIAQDGTILRDSRKGEGVSPTGRLPGFGATVKTDKLTLNDVPAAVQKQIKASGDAATVKEIKRTTRDGRVVYEVECEKEGKNTRLQIAEDGTILKDNRQ